MNPNSDEVAHGDRRLCAHCVGEVFLKNLVESTGEEAECSYCKRQGKTFVIADVAGLVEKALEQHAYQTRNEYDDVGIRPGDNVAIVIAEAAGIDDESAEHVRSFLEERHFDRERDEMGEKGPFDEDTCYARKEPDDVLYQEEWFRFENSLKTEARFFSRIAHATLENVFRELDAHRTDQGHPVIIVAGKDKKLESLYRARVFQSDDKLKVALMRPDREIGPPASVLANAGRMNARGISVFYGATKPKTALAELRPPVGSDVIVGRFDFVRDVRLLDVDALASLDVTGSIFDPTYLPRLERAKFLSLLSHRITRPILPDDELSEYLVTQAIADYLATELKLDGIMYRSAQNKGGKNVALFHHAARVESYDLPEGSEARIYTNESDKDGVQRAFTVYEEVPKAQLPTPKPAHLLDWDVGVDPLPKPDPVLKLDVESIRVHEVMAVDYSSQEYKVTRSRHEKRGKPDF